MDCSRELAVLGLLVFHQRFLCYGINDLKLLAGRSTTASHVNNLATHKNVFLSASKKLGPGSKKPEEQVHCHSCQKDCAKQRFYRKQVSVKGFTLLVEDLLLFWLCFYYGI